MYNSTQEDWEWREELRGTVLAPSTPNLYSHTEANLSYGVIQSSLWSVFPFCQVQCFKYVLELKDWSVCLKLVTP